MANELASMNYVFPYGKYKGMTLLQVYNDNKKYLEWYMKNGRNVVVKRHIREYAEALKTATRLPHDNRFSFSPEIIEPLEI